MLFVICHFLHLIERLRISFVITVQHLLPNTLIIPYGLLMIPSCIIFTSSSFAFSFSLFYTFVYCIGFFFGTKKKQDNLSFLDFSFTLLDVTLGSVFSIHFFTTFSFICYNFFNTSGRLVREIRILDGSLFSLNNLL